MQQGNQLSNIFNALIFELAAVSMVVMCTSYFGQMLSIGSLYMLFYVSTLLFLFIYFEKIIKKLNVLTISYLSIIIICSIAHIGVVSSTLATNEFFLWTLPILFIIISSNYKINIKFLVLFILALYLSMCIVNIYERITLSHPINFRSELMDYFIKAGKKDIQSFRSFGLIGHPLTNANILSIFVAFILTSRMSPFYKNSLTILGLITIWCINSRGAMYVWIVILIYWLLFKNKKWYYSLILFIFFLLIAPYLLDWLIQGNYLGRVNFDFTDDSTLTRLMSWGVFANQKWNFDKILFGGVKLTLPGTSLLLENGVLLNMGYWGWFFGIAKLTIEILITYKALERYKKTNRIVIMAATWGVALLNNNVFFYLTLQYFVVIYAVFNYLNYQSNLLHAKRFRSSPIL